MRVPLIMNTVWWKPPSVGSSSTGSAPMRRRYQGRLTDRSLTVTATWPIGGNSNIAVSGRADGEREDVGAGVVAGGVEGPAAGGDAIEAERRGHRRRGAYHGSFED